MQTNDQFSFVHTLGMYTNVYIIANHIIIFNLSPSSG